MRYITIKNFKPGMVLGRPLLDEKGNILLKEGNVVSEVIYKRILNMEVQGLYVKDEFSNDILVEDLIRPSLKHEALKSLMNNNISTSIKLAREIVDELKRKNSLQVNLIDIKNNKNYPYKHCVSVCIYSVIIGLAIGLNEEDLDNLAIAAMLHDIAKFDLPDELLFKKNPLNQEEMNIMRNLPKLSYKKLSEINEISSQSRNAVLHTHENENGSGYPYGKTGDKIHILAKILHITNCFDAMTSPSYKKPCSIPEAVEFIMGNSNTMFDSNLVNVFINKFPIFPVGLTVKLSNGETAIIVTNEHNSLRPIIRLLNSKKNYPLIDLSDNKEYFNVTITGID